MRKGTLEFAVEIGGEGYDATCEYTAYPAEHYPGCGPSVELGELLLDSLGVKRLEEMCLEDAAEQGQ